ncbi:MAG: outer membrane lipoprotein-sorting protein [Candidatus Asgardarchaeia archaeon]
MVKKINKVGVIVVTIALVSLTLGVNQLLATDLSSVLEQTKEKYAKFGEEIKDMTIVQEMKMVTEEGEMTEEMKMFKKGKKFRIETTMRMPEVPDMPEEMALTNVIIYDGKNSWMISPFMGKQKLPYEEGKEYQMGMDWWEFISEKTKVIGTEKIGERECYVVDAEEEEELSFTRLWLDKENLALIKGESKEPEGETTVWIYSDFRKIKGNFEMPYKMEMYTDGKLMGILFIKSLEINKGLSDDLFDPDKVKIKGFDMEEMMKKMMQEEE